MDSDKKLFQHKTKLILVFIFVCVAAMRDVLYVVFTDYGHVQQSSK